MRLQCECGTHGKGVLHAAIMEKIKGYVFDICPCPELQKHNLWKQYVNAISKHVRWPVLANHVLFQSMVHLSLNSIFYCHKLMTGPPFSTEAIDRIPVTLFVHVSDDHTKTVEGGTQDSRISISKRVITNTHRQRK